MKSLLTVTALVEGSFGLALAIVPSLVVPILLRTSLTDSGAILIGRLAGVALITIAIACWLLRNDTRSDVMVKVMLVYNIFSTALLVYAALLERISGPGLWPAVLLHVGLLVWCLSSLRNSIAIKM
jgi:hypothetical protein